MNDIALLRLKNKVESTSRTIRPICLPDQDEDIRADTECLATGWGAIKRSSRLKNKGKISHLQLWEVI